MELFKVKISFEDVIAKKDWDKLCAKMSKSPQIKLEDYPSPPPRKEVTTYVAIYKEEDHNDVQKISEIAYTSIIGAKESWKKYMPFTLSLEYLGGVHTEKMS